MAERIGEYDKNKALSENVFYIKQEFQDHIDSIMPASDTAINTNSYEFNEKNIKTEVLSEVHTNISYDNVKIKDEVIGTDNIKVEFHKDQLICDSCNEYYQDYCTKCGMLEHILNRNKEVPKEILEIRTLFECLGVFALKTIPKGVKFGPFTGLSTSGSSWRIKQRKLIASNNMAGNWMQYINSASSISEQNLIPFQYRGDLYYRSNRNIWEGEELLVYFGEKYEDSLNKESEMDFIPPTENDVKSVFACTFCCLGFSRTLCLFQHKNVCPNGTGEKFLPEALTQCLFCNIYLGEREYLQYHMTNCSKNNSSQCVLPVPGDETIKVEESSFTSNKSRRCILYKCTRCSYRTIYKIELTSHISKHCNLKMNKRRNCHPSFKRKKNYKVKFQMIKKYYIKTHPKLKGKDISYRCVQCEFRTKNMSDLQQHIKVKHVAETIYKCSGCDFQTNCESDIKVHENESHHKETDYKWLNYDTGTCNKSSGIVQHINSKNSKEKTFECVECGFKTRYKSNLKIHISAKHGKGNTRKCLECDYETYYESNLKTHISAKHRKEKGYKCLECDFAASTKTSLKDHINAKHRQEKAYNCLECDHETNYESNLKRHIDRKHRQKKGYKCLECDFETNYRSRLKDHVNIKHLKEGVHQCLQCDFRTNYKPSLKTHINAKHSREIAYKCSECNFSTNYKTSLRDHVNAKHNIEAAFKCSECDFKTNYRSHLTTHISVKHRDKKIYNCSECKFSTNYKSSLTEHKNAKHSQKTGYRCLECDFITSYKSSLREHIRAKHQNAAYKCSECDFETRSKSYLKVHVDTKHRKVTYKCSECDFTTGYKLSLRDHKVRKHTKESSLECNLETNTCLVPSNETGIKKETDHECVD